jgi:hypothetical protein
LHHKGPTIAQSKKSRKHKGRSFLAAIFFVGGVSLAGAEFSGIPYGQLIGLFLLVLMAVLAGD